MFPFCFVLINSSVMCLQDETRSVSQDRNKESRLSSAQGPSSSRGFVGPSVARNFRLCPESFACLFRFIFFFHPLSSPRGSAALQLLGSSRDTEGGEAGVSYRVAIHTRARFRSFDSLRETLEIFGLFFERSINVGRGQFFISNRDRIFGYNRSTQPRDENVCRNVCLQGMMRIMHGLLRTR